MGARLGARLNSTPGLGPERVVDGRARSAARRQSPVSSAAADQSLALARQALVEARATPDVSRRFVCAHIAALRSAAALLADRATPTRGRSRRQRTAWELVRNLAPELDEWVLVFEASARKRAIAEAGVSNAVTDREADDLVRDAEAFLAIVARSVGAPEGLPATTHLRQA